MKKPPLALQVTTLWDYPSQSYGEETQGNPHYAGVSPSYVIWNLLQRYTQPKDLVIDPMAGSGTTLDVARDLGRRALGYDLQPQRKDIFRADARKLPLEDGKVDLAFIDPPYSRHIKYSGLPECIGELSAREDAYFPAMHRVIKELHRVLRTGGHLGLYVSDSFKKDRPLVPIGFRLFALLEHYFETVDLISVTRHNADLEKGNYRKAAEEENFFLRGFNYLFIMRKAVGRPRVMLPDYVSEPALVANLDAHYEELETFQREQEARQSLPEPRPIRRSVGKTGAKPFKKGR